MNRKLLLLFIFFLLVMVILTPDEDAYFERISNDYGEIHQSESLNKEELQELGDFEFHNRLFYSQFKYQFGNISVSYFGFMSFIIFEKSEFVEPNSPQITV